MSEETLNRRAFSAGVAATVAAAALLKDERAEAQQRTAAPVPMTLLATPAEKAVVPLPYAPGALTGLSERLVRSHHENNYAGAVRKLNEIRRQLASADPDQSGGYWSLYGSLRAAELSARNSAHLHELYFSNLAAPPAGDAGVTPSAGVAAVLSARFGSVDRFQAQLRGAAKASNGWVALVVDPASRTLELVQTEGHAFGAWEASPLVVLDMYEHAYAIDFGADKGAYLTAFWRCLHWAEVERRLNRALTRA
ncbi:MAG: Fe-Mn family superoxide dismutase [Polyangiales bacterium]